MFIAALFIIARTWKQSGCPSPDKWIRKLWYIYTMEYSVQFSHSVLSDFLRPHESQHARPPCPSTEEWTKKLWYIYAMEYYSAMKKNTFESVLMRWMKLEPIIQSEISQKEKHQYSILTHIYGI